MENLLKCEQVLINLYAKVEQVCLNIFFKNKYNIYLGTETKFLIFFLERFAA